jgi:hypothetical protein
MSSHEGVVANSICVTRVNSRILQDPRLHMLLQPAHIKHKYPYSQFNFPMYFADLSSREDHPIEPAFIEFCAPANFVYKYSNLINLIYNKHRAKMVYYDPQLYNYYQGCVWGFLFDDAKHQLMFELAHNDLRANARNFPES